jgi:hypothetical protein
MILNTLQLFSALRSLPNEAQIQVRAASGEAIVTVCRHEAEILADNGHVEGVANRRRLKHLRLTVAPRVAMARLRKRLCATGRTVAEACQLTVVQEVAGRRVLYAHHTRRIAAYEPGLRQGSHPTYGLLRAAV